MYRNLTGLRFKDHKNSVAYGSDPPISYRSTAIIVAEVRNEIEDRVTKSAEKQRLKKTDPS